MLIQKQFLFLMLNDMFGIEIFLLYFSTSLKDESFLLFFNPVGDYNFYYIF